MRGRATWLVAIVVTGLAAWLALPGLYSLSRIYCVVLLVLLPALSVAQVRLLDPATEVARGTVYMSSALGLLALGAITVAVAWNSPMSARQMGLLPVEFQTVLLWGGATAIAAIALVLAGHVLGVREGPLLQKLLPRTRADRAAFAGLSLIAGTMEELVFRGFLIAALSRGTGSTQLAILLSAGAFGVLHAYQKASGVIRASGMGLLLTVPLLVTGSLYPSMLAHTAIDLVDGLWLGPRLLR